MRFKKILFSIIQVYLLVLLGVFFLQDDFLYYPSKRPLPDPAIIAPSYQKVQIKTQDNLDLVAWYAPAKKGKPTLLEMQGNADSLYYRLQLAQPYLDAGWGIFLLGYRGFSGNPGKITEKGLYLDANAAWNYLIQHQVNNHCIILYGTSLGTGVVVETALSHQAAALVLQSPYTSIPAVAQLHYPFFPMRWIMKGQYNSLAKIKNVHTPVLILHGKKDQLIPVQYGETLFIAANSPKQFIAFNDVGHENWDFNQLGAIVMQWVLPYTANCK